MKFIIVPLFKFIEVGFVYIVCYPFLAAIFLLIAVWQWEFKKWYVEYTTMHYCGAYNNYELIGYYKTPWDYLNNRITPLNKLSGE